MSIPRDSNLRDMRQIARHRDRTLKNLELRKKEYIDNEDKVKKRINSTEEKRERRNKKRLNDYQE